MLIIHHRRNTLELLAKTPSDWGVEMDVRSYGDKLVVHHDPFVKALSLEEWLTGYHHRLVILNTKEEGLEDRLLPLMAQHHIQDGVVSPGCRHGESVKTKFLKNIRFSIDALI